MEKEIIAGGAANGHSCVHCSVNEKRAPLKKKKTF
jgi:hypothetical protein